MIKLFDRNNQEPSNLDVFLALIKQEFFELLILLNLYNKENSIIYYRKLAWFSVLFFMFAVITVSSFLSSVFLFINLFK